MPFKDKPPLWSAWWSMRQRCEKPDYPQFKDYGGRGITVCKEWLSYAQFERDMGPKPTPWHSLDRIDNDKGYSPDNCRWATRKEQQRNQRRTRRVTIEGVEYLAIELAEKAGVKVDTIVKRAEQGLSLAEVTRYDPTFRDKGGLRLGPSTAASAKKARTHCRHGHELTMKNTLITKEGWRACRACHANRQRERRHRLIGA